MAKKPFITDVRESAESFGAHNALQLSHSLVEASADVAADRGDNPGLTGHFRGVELRRALELTELTTGSAPVTLVRAGRALGAAAVARRGALPRKGGAS